MAKKQNNSLTYGQITKNFIRAYILDSDNEDDKAWLVEFLTNDENKREYERNTKEGKKKSLEIDVKKLRRAFCERFEDFKKLIPAEEKKLSWEEETIKQLLGE